MPAQDVRIVLLNVLITHTHTSVHTYKHMPPQTCTQEHTRMGTPCTHTQRTSCSPEWRVRLPSPARRCWLARRPLWAGPGAELRTPDRPSPPHTPETGRLLSSVPGKGGLGTLPRGCRGDAGSGAEPRRGPMDWSPRGRAPGALPTPLAQKPPPLPGEAHLCWRDDSASLRPCGGPRQGHACARPQQKPRTARPI